MDAEHLKVVTLSSPELLTLLLRYERFFLAQVQQTTACNALHTIEQRMCKWLVRMHDLTGDELPLTQEFMAQMMGARRSSVSAVAAISSWFNVNLVNVIKRFASYTKISLAGRLRSGGVHPAP